MSVGDQQIFVSSVDVVNPNEETKIGKGENSLVSESLDPKKAQHKSTVINSPSTQAVKKESKWRNCCKTNKSARKLQPGKKSSRNNNNESVVENTHRDVPRTPLKIEYSSVQSSDLPAENDPLPEVLPIVPSKGETIKNESSSSESATSETAPMPVSKSSSQVSLHSNLSKESSNSTTKETLDAKSLENQTMSGSRDCIDASTPSMSSSRGNLAFLHSDSDPKPSSKYVIEPLNITHPSEKKSKPTLANENSIISSTDTSNEYLDHSSSTDSNELELPQPFHSEKLKSINTSFLISRNPTLARQSSSKSKIVARSVTSSLISLSAKQAVLPIHNHESLVSISRSRSNILQGSSQTSNEEQTSHKALESIRSKSTGRKKRSKRSSRDNSSRSVKIRSTLGLYESSIKPVELESSVRPLVMLQTKNIAHFMNSVNARAHSSTSQLSPIEKPTRKRIPSMSTPPEISKLRELSAIESSYEDPTLESNDQDFDFMTGITPVEERVFARSQEFPFKSRLITSKGYTGAYIPYEGVLATEKIERMKDSSVDKSRMCCNSDFCRSESTDIYNLYDLDLKYKGAKNLQNVH